MVKDILVVTIAGNYQKFAANVCERVLGKLTIAD